MAGGSPSAVAEAIEREFGIEYHPGHVWRILKRLGWSYQRPTGRAPQRSEEKIRWWMNERWPAIKKKAAGRPARGCEWPLSRGCPAG